MTDWSKEDIDLFIQNKETGLVYFYTPICGTCQMAGKMLEVIAKLFPNMKIGRTDLNYIPALAEQFEVKSVPCLLIIQNGQVMETIFAFQSVPYLHEKIKSHLA
ncbi:thioredoxin family protein [Mesobacillus maritimus]|uniref:Thioredoxin family protein n=1 Tax=Mesobacillus maritimus TaxID=1643336 RepID=A0ABS7K404_9BACI|nr:thioredoxin family protein [Mesobacillus maritimus]MBY0096987.1 thioredoxin family protein [Mesobacillus maritimus]